MLLLYRYLKGYLLLEFTGEFAAKIFNLCARRNIALWNMRCSKQRITACIRVSDFCRLRFARKKSRIHIHILKKRGLPFFVSKYSKRVGFFAGAACFFALLYFLSGFIWTVRVSGNRKISEGEILAVCREIGIYEGIHRDKIDTKNKKEELLLKIDSLAWASLNIEGCVLTVEVTEVREKEGSAGPSNLKASADGVIKRIDVKGGYCALQVGDAVRQGDVLVSGVVERGSYTEFVPSVGTIVAETQRRITATKGSEQELSVETGEVFKKRVLRLFGLDFPLFVGAVSGENSTEVTVKNTYLFGSKLPFSIFTKEYRSIETRMVQYSAPEMEEQLTADIKAQLEALGISKYTFNNQNTVVDGTTYTMIWDISAEENIAYQETLLISEGI